ncbi:MAG: VanZ family protein [Burkholderiaceae bacterium]|nr:VanZ family protein [Burkholderiaceae bacterium]
MRTAERRFALAAALGLYLAFVAYQSLAGGWAKPCAAPLLDPGGRWSGGDALANLVAYVPAGLLAASLAASFKGAAVRLVAWLVVVMFSLSMEVAQACLGGRVSSWIDWATNSAGATLGFVALPAAAALLQSLSRRKGRGVRAALPVTLAAWLVVGTWLATSTVPWRFTLDVGTIRANLAFLGVAPSLDAWAVARHAFAWMAVAAALRALVARRRSASVALVATIALAIGAQVLLEWRALSWSELAGVTLGAAVSLVLLVPGSDGRLARIAPALAFVSVLVYELAPGHPGWAIGGRFSWWPLVGRGSLLAALDFTLYFCWFAFVLVLALRWMGTRARSTVVVGSLAVAVLLALELAQRAIPGRTADTSPALIVGLAFVVAWLLTDRPGERATARVRSRSHRPVVESVRRS